MKTKMWLFTLLSLFMSFFITAPAVAKVNYDGSPGSWQVVANCPGVNPIHTAMLSDGRFLMMWGSGYNKSNFDDMQAGIQIQTAAIYDPSTPSVCPRFIDLPAGKDLFCAGMVHLSDGRIVIFGGTGRYGVQGSNSWTYDDGPDRKKYYGGIKDAYVFNEQTETFDKLADMDVARWYGNSVIRADGSVVVYGGIDEESRPTNGAQVINTSLDWMNPTTPTALNMPMYAGNALLPNGWFFYTGTNFGGQTFGQSPMRWSPFSNTKYPVTGLVNPQCRDQGNTVVMYPIVWVLGGGCTDSTGNHGVTGVSSYADMSPGKTLQFNTGPYAYAGMHQCAAGLPDQSIFLSHGTDHNKEETASLKAMRLGQGDAAWQTLASPTVKRGYHSTCLISKDGKVFTLGTDWDAAGDVETRIEIYSPWYAQSGFVRPRIADLGQPEHCGVTELTPGQTVYAKTEVASIVGGTLTKIPSVTHQYDPNNRVVPLVTEQTDYGNVTITIPKISPMTPKGEYMLSLLDWRGAPTISKMVNLGGSSGCCC